MEIHSAGEDALIVYLGEGHGVEAATRQAIIDDWNANGGR